MTWAKLDDGFHCHPKVMPVGMAARGLWATAASWVGDHLTDGVIPKAVVKAMGKNTMRMAAELVVAELWIESEQSFTFSQWLKYNRSREQVLAERDTTKTRVSKHRDRRCNAVSNAPVTVAPDPGSRIPIQTPELKEESAPPFEFVQQPKETRAIAAPSLAEHIARAYEARHKAVTGFTHSGASRRAAASLGDWATQNGPAQGVTPLRLAESVLDGFFAHDSARKAGFPLSFASTTPVQYLNVAKPKEEFRGRVTQEDDAPAKIDQWRREAERDAPLIAQDRADLEKETAAFKARMAEVRARRAAAEKVAS